MPGSGVIPVRPAWAAVADAQATQPYSVIPPPYANLAPTGVADCNNLLADSPPTILQRFEIYGFSIPGAIQVFASSAFPSAPDLSFTMELLVNGDLAAGYTVPVSPMMASSTNYVATAVFNSDLVNPVQVGARDRLSLRLTGITSLTANVEMNMLVGVAYDAAPRWDVSEGRIFYNVVDLAASRRI